MKEADILVEVQKHLATPGVLATARGLSHFGEHALGWMGMGALGALIDAPRRGQWVRLAAAAFVSHAISVVVKRIVRRKRPHDPRIKIGVGTPSKLSFPSSHATSTSAALVSLARITRNPLPLLGIPVMMVSRMVLGVHYPTDVATGALVGAVTAEAIARTGKVK
ncbi:MULTISPECIES: phosphatase PAP2 family protein [Corynebacterium]|uniref:Phosphatase PAP2 family protein n=1 Tax=Corynebacterium belfantii TaxID=2014537 RepID=A0ABS0LD83_9CORY|nr:MULTISPECIES: phosphatase PAP2 family protein [Corynebacterium]OLN15358.1 phosphatase PAP2 family protein [Corynebacterium diphtheriae subsp. lausannense]AEX45138.1 putative integral membrane protein [Corynebacterium diphtheriae 241]AEX75328.1 putative integral membrane protein [Corynebacterium diphtheriae HC01]AWR16918.1 putative integral membrane protein [Corynebacterium diphtheriae]MBG9221542.1 phosphatase PAP2 family protein [Corynebacterium diphtheriae bv. mitis]